MLYRYHRHESGKSQGPAQKPPFFHEICPKVFCPNSLLYALYILEFLYTLILLIFSFLITFIVFFLILQVMHVYCRQLGMQKGIR